MAKSADKLTLEKITGASIPVGSLKTKDSCGVGEFLDLIPFADFCKKCDLELIQILPVNDTGTESSPYSALSAFALNPIYISLKNLPEVSENKEILDEISKLQKKHEKEKRFSYRNIRNEKFAILKKIYESAYERIIKDKKLSEWEKSNEWVKAYSIFMQKKMKYMEASWKEWPEQGHPTKEQIDKIWDDKKSAKENKFFSWMQMRLDEQFKKASAYITSLGIKLKGDIPIMMNEDSCDTWAFPEYFNDELRAGSPPDGSNPTGQNWGFPIYNWKNLKKDNYSWWKNRLLKASEYYQVYRIDHILGFFRIWATPARETTAMLGWTQPFETITRDDLKELGFSDDRITWLTKPHIPTYKIQEINGGDYQGTVNILSKLMTRIGNEELWLFKPSIKNDKDILESDIPENIKAKLSELWRDKAFVEVSKNKYAPLWTFQDTTAWQSLNDNEKYLLGTMIAKRYAKMDSLWEKQARTILKELTACTKMIACAEDLGSNPECLPDVLKDLSILSLKVVRWNREWELDNKPFIKFEDYPLLSVTTSSVHDSSTLRSWWLEEKDAEVFAEDFELPKEIKPGKYDSKTARTLLETIATSNSAFCIHPIQDFLGLVDEYLEENPDDERVNIPGSVTEFNWTYRLPTEIEKICKNTELTDEIKKICKIHKEN